MVGSLVIPSFTGSGLDLVRQTEGLGLLLKSVPNTYEDFIFDFGESPAGGVATEFSFLHIGWKVLLVRVSVEFPFEHDAADSLTGYVSSFSSLVILFF